MCSFYAIGKYMSCNIKVLWAMYTYTFAYSETLKCGILPKRQNKKIKIFLSERKKYSTKR